MRLLTVGFDISAFMCVCLNMSCLAAALDSPVVHTRINSSATFQAQQLRLLRLGNWPRGFESAAVEICLSKHQPLTIMREHRRRKTKAFATMFFFVIYLTIFVHVCLPVLFSETLVKFHWKIRFTVHTEVPFKPNSFLWICLIGLNPFAKSSWNYRSCGFFY